MFSTYTAINSDAIFLSYQDMMGIQIYSSSVNRPLSEMTQNKLLFNQKKVLLIYHPV